MSTLFSFIMTTGPKIKFGILFALVFGLLSSVSLSTQATETLSDDQRDEIEKVIHDYIMENPSVLLEAIQSLREQEDVADKQQAVNNLELAAAALYEDPMSPITGNPDASVTVVEFFDYRCGYCKRVFPALEELMNTDGDINIVFKEFPILGDDSVFASRAAIATWLNWPEKYLKFHSEMITSRGALSTSKVFELAATAQIDITKLKKAMKSPDVDEAISRNMQLAEFLKINGTPGFIIGNEIIPGAIDIETMRDLIKRARKNS